MLSFSLARSLKKFPREGLGVTWSASKPECQDDGRKNAISLSSPATPNHLPQAGDDHKAFPPELIDIIIDHLHADNKSLAACTLVCRSWLPSSRYHLFSTITVIAHPQLSFWPLIRFLEEAKAIALFICDLNLWGQTSENFSIEVPLDAEPSLCHHSLAVMVSKLPTLRRLAIRGVRFAHTFSPLVPRSNTVKRFGKMIRSRSKRVREPSAALQAPACDLQSEHPLVERRVLASLAVRTCGSSTFPPVDFLKIPDLFSVIRKLVVCESLAEGTWYDGPSSTQLDASSIPQFRVYSMMMLWSSPSLLSILRQSSCLTSLTALSVGFDTWQDVVSTGLVLREIHTGLRTLALNETSLLSRYGSVDPDEWSALSLQSCVKLDTIKLELRLDFNISPDSDFYSQVCASALDTLAFVPTSVSHVILRLTLDANMTLSDFDNILDWLRMEELLLRLKHLESVVIIQADRPDVNKLDAVVIVGEYLVSLSSRMPRIQEMLDKLD